jgi:hypothetical protein
MVARNGKNLCLPKREIVMVLKHPQGQMVLISKMEGEPETML